MSPCAHELIPMQVGRRMFYNDEQGETVPASDDEDSEEEPERVGI